MICFESDIKSKSNKSKNKQDGDYIKLKSLCTTKETINKVKRQLTERERIFANDVSEKELISKIHKELRVKKKNPPNNPIKNFSKGNI